MPQLQSTVVNFRKLTSNLLCSLPLSAAGTFKGTLAVGGFIRSNGLTNSQVQELRSLGLEVHGNYSASSAPMTIQPGANIAAITSKGYLHELSGAGTSRTA